MTRKTNIIPLAPLDRLIKRAGARRVSQDARERLAEILEGIGIEISEQAVMLANHAGRCTVTAPDFAAAMSLRGNPRSPPKNF